MSQQFYSLSFFFSAEQLYKSELRVEVTTDNSVSH